MVRQLQHEERLVSRDLSNRHCRLARVQRQPMDGPDGWRCWAHHEAGIPAGQPLGSALRQYGASGWRFVLGNASANSIPVSQVHQAAGKRNDGTEAETTGAGTAGPAEEMTAKLRQIVTVASSSDNYQ